MVDLTKLTSTVNSSFSTLGSIDLYCVYDGVDYRIKPETLQDVVGRAGGCGLLLNSETEITSSDTGVLSFGSVMYEDGAGWQDLVNSPTILIAPRPMIAMCYGVTKWWGGGFPTHVYILRNNSADTSQPYGVRGSYQYTTEIHTHRIPPIVCDSGTIFTMSPRVSAATSTRTLDGGSTSFHIYPLAYL